MKVRLCSWKLSYIPQQFGEMMRQIGFDEVEVDDVVRPRETDAPVGDPGVDLVVWFSEDRPVSSLIYRPKTSQLIVAGEESSRGRWKIPEDQIEVHYESLERLALVGLGLVQARCSHEHVHKKRFIKEVDTGVHGPYSEKWLVRCAYCGKLYEEVLSKD